MKITYTGKHTLTPVQQKKLEAKVQKLSKLVDGPRGEREAHVILTSERHLHRSEITVNFYDHPMVGVGSDPDQLTAITESIDKLEKQILKARTKWRDTKRTKAGPRAAAWGRRSLKMEGAAVPEEAGPEEEEERPAAGRVFRVNHHNQRKPMTLEEALLEMEDGHRDYLAYRDAETERVSVLLRRRDGNFDLIEA